MSWLRKIFKKNYNSNEKNSSTTPNNTTTTADEKNDKKTEDVISPTNKINSMKLGNVRSDQPPSYTMEQLNRARKSYSDRKAARLKARQEEQRYVEFRKAEILFKFHPKFATLQSADEAFPRRKSGSMGFGERKAHYLAIRPKSCYATWIGRKKTAIESKPPITCVPDVTANTTDHSALPMEGTSRKVSSQEKKKEKITYSIKEDSSKLVDQEKGKKSDINAVGTIENTIITAQQISSGFGKNNNSPIVNGVPFWTIYSSADEDDITDDDLPVDMEILEKVCSGERHLDPRPFKKTEFFPFGPVARMKSDDVLFDRETILFTNTVETVIRLQPEGDETPETLRMTPKQVTWGNTIRVTTYDPKNRLPKKERVAVEEPLKNVIREAN